MKPYQRIPLCLVFVLAPAFAQEEEAPAPSVQSSPFSQAKFVPDISLILDCSYFHRNVTDKQYDELFVPGLALSHEHEAPCRGFNLNYGEITFYSVVDPYFELFAVCHLSEHHFHLEEAYWLTKKFPAGVQLKAGKFLSGFGRINEQHAHYWDFADRPLVHHAAFGGEGLNEVGARLTWVAPLETYLMFGGEILMGSNEASFGRTGFQDARGSVRVNSVNGPRVFVGYCKASVDVDDASVLFGMSAPRGNTRVEEGFSAGNAGGTALAGHTVKRDVHELRQAECEVQARGYYEGIGRAISHKARILEVYLQGKTYAEIENRMRHTMQAIKRYVEMFGRVVYAIGRSCMRSFHDFKLQIKTFFLTSLVHQLEDVLYSTDPLERLCLTRMSV
jgi:hypothetical protein